MPARGRRARILAPLLSSGAARGLSAAVLMPPLYDLMLVLNPSASEEERTKVQADVDAAIAASGEAVGSHDWGQRALAYEIDHTAEGEYHLVQFHGPPALLDRLRATLRVADAVLRFRIIRLAPGPPAPPPPPSAAPVAAVGEGEHERDRES